MQYKLLAIGIFCATVLSAKEAPLAPAWKVQNSTNQSISVKPFFKSKQPTFNSDEQSYIPITIAPGKQELIEFGPGTDGSFYYTPSRLEISAGEQQLVWTAPKENYYQINVEFKNNKLQATTKDWSFADILKRKSKIKQDYPNRDAHYFKEFKPRLDTYLKTH